MPTISQLPAASAVGSADLFAIVQSGVTKKATSSLVLAYITTTLGLGTAAFVNVPILPVNGGTGIASPTAHSLPIAEGTAAFNFVNLVDGGLLIGSTGADPVPANITAGTGVTVTNAPGSITIAATGGSVNTGTINALAYYAAAGTAISPLTTANSSSLVTSLTGIPTWLGPLTNGQIVVGSTGAIPVAAILTAGPGISIANGAGTITISGTGSGIGWTEVTGTTQAMTADSGYVSSNAGLVTLTLPTTSAFGTAISLVGKGAGGWRIAQNASQIVQVGNLASTTGVGGSVSSTNRFDSIDLICTTANTIWTTVGGTQGNLTIV
jgi:hypothetical protein